jgi:hypothetical protein
MKTASTTYTVLACIIISAVACFILHYKFGNNNSYSHEDKYIDGDINHAVSSKVNHENVSHESTHGDGNLSNESPSKERVFIDFSDPETKRKLELMEQKYPTKEDAINAIRSGKFDWSLAVLGKMPLISTNPGEEKIGKILNQLERGKTGGWRPKQPMEIESAEAAYTHLMNNISLLVKLAPKKYWEDENHVYLPYEAAKQDEFMFGAIVSKKDGAIWTWDLYNK